MEGVHRRSVIAGLGATGVALGLGRTALAQERGTHGGHGGQYDAITRECIDACTKCRTECLAGIQHCLSKGGDHVRAEHLKLLATCAEICTVAADFMLMDSEHDKKLCALCEELCRECADSCDQFANDAMMKHCATVCRECADACRRFIRA